MNTLSILIYVADALPKFGIWAIIMGMIAVMFGLITIIIGKFVPWSYTDDNDVAARNNIDKYGVRFLLIGLIMSAGAMLIPSQKTFYLIAASELGEIVITHPDTVEIYDEVRETILTYIREYNKKD